MLRKLLEEEYCSTNDLNESDISLILQQLWEISLDTQELVPTKNILRLVSAKKHLGLGYHIATIAISNNLICYKISVNLGRI